MMPSCWRRPWTPLWWNDHSPLRRNPNTCVWTKGMTILQAVGLPPDTAIRRTSDASVRRSWTPLASGIQRAGGLWNGLWQALQAVRFWWVVERTLAWVRARFGVEGAGVCPVAAGRLCAVANVGEGEMTQQEALREFGSLRQEGVELPRSASARMCAPVVPSAVAPRHFEIGRRRFGLQLQGFPVPVGEAVIAVGPVGNRALHAGR